MGHVKSHFGLLRDSVSAGTRQVYSLRQTYHRLRNRFGCTGWYSYVAKLKWKLILVHLEIMLILTQDRCTVFAEPTIGSKIVLDAPDGILGDVGHVESRFGPFQDSVSVDAR
jgi:hypothetical protein